MMESLAATDHMDISEPMQLDKREHARQSRGDYATKFAMAAWRTGWRIFRTDAWCEFRWAAACVVMRFCTTICQSDGGWNNEEPFWGFPVPFFKEPRIQFSRFDSSSGLFRATAARVRGNPRILPPFAAYACRRVAPLVVFPV